MKEIFVTVSNIEEIIETINFQKIYSFFKKQQIAIYKDGFLYFTSYKTPFNHSVRDSMKSLKDVAILNYESLSHDNLINAGLFIKQMVMNMFYQKHDVRIPNDLIALQYPNIYLNYDYIRYERQLLVKAYTATDNYVKLNYLRMFLNVRDLRRQLVGNEFSMLEYGLETITGLSEYAMYKAIYSKDKKVVKNRVKDNLKYFTTDQKYFDFRHINMFSGLLLILLMNDLQIDIEMLYESELNLYQVLCKKINFIREPIAFKSDKSLLQKITDYEESISEKFSIFFENEPKRVAGYYQIYAFDPERIFVDKDNLYHESFVILKNLLNNELIKIEGPVITKIMDNSFDIVTSYHYLDNKKIKGKNKKKVG